MCTFCRLQNKLSMRLKLFFSPFSKFSVIQFCVLIFVKLVKCMEKSYIHKIVNYTITAVYNYNTMDISTPSKQFKNDYLPPTGHNGMRE